ncbi:UV radiation resistance-associated gene protein isoform X1 [Anopheles darlingi]|uniref:UV radiation resistance-associated gene protein isoform X1 n=1 Tax=Anopheles darlingi TaxID=43151 RepID=UPI0020FFFF3D|nr:UV radiation resistance-associated gene protein isoform X1 [Anopheles darlingi]XP_049538047.1 UV radiation resistance-associated gene protein isoform X1 [Anopheles darlingi]
MFERPRCRDWSPLSTQQLRLRSLIQVSGHNITTTFSSLAGPERGTPLLGERGKCFVYFTLHQTLDSAPFYTSEKLDLHRNVLWADIECPATMKSSLRAVCVRVWEHIAPSGAMVSPLPVPTSSPSDIRRRSSVTMGTGIVTHRVGEPEQENTTEPPPAPSPDRVLFVWGVHFSGLVPLVRRSEKRLRPNTLVFQMHGGYFTSADCILEPEERRVALGGLELPSGQASRPKTPIKLSSSPASGARPITASIPIEGAGSRGSGGRGSHCDTSGNSPLFLPPPNLHHASPASNHHWYFANSVQQPLQSSGSPVSETRGGTVTASVSPTPSEPPETNLRIRYLHMEFGASEIRTSYDLVRLLAVQERQRRLRYEADSAKELTERICMKSAYCLNLELFNSKHPSVYRGPPATNRSGGMGKQLSRLLYQEREPIDPAMLLRGQELRRQIERARFRCRLLAQERERALMVIQSLRYKLHALSDANIERESTLMERYRTYGREKEQLSYRHTTLANYQERVREARAEMWQAKQKQLRMLNDIFYIKKTAVGMYTINDVPLPNAESYPDSTPALALSVALGFVAQAVRMCSKVLDIPLRNPVKLDGSRSKIVDTIKVLPTTDREFPLFCRSGPAPNAVLYAVYLLNQNISQLKFQLGMSRGDPRATLANLESILAVVSVDSNGAAITAAAATSTGGGNSSNSGMEIITDGVTLISDNQRPPFPIPRTQSSGCFGGISASSSDLKLSPAFHSLSLGGGGSSSGSSSSSSYLRDSPSSRRISSSVDDYTNRLHRLPMPRGTGADQQHQQQLQHQHQQLLRGCGSRFSSDPILTKAPQPRPLEFEGGKKF